MADCEKFLCQCIKYQCFDDAIYAVEALTIKEKQNYSLLLGYLFMRKREYRRALHYFLKTSCFSSTIYQALCFRSLKEYDRAWYILSNINTMCDEKERVLSPLESFYILEKDMSFVNNLLGTLNVETSFHEKALSSHYEAVMANPLFYTSYKMVLEDSLPEIRKGEREEENYIGPEYSEKPSNTYVRCPSLAAIDKTLREKVKSPYTDARSAHVIHTIIEESTIAEKILLGVPEEVLGVEQLNMLPLTAISALGVQIFECGFHQWASTLFSYIFSRDPFCIDAMHYYSSILWHKRDKKMLGVLCRTTFGINPFSHVSWAVLGNHFSLRKETDKAVMCFERSLSLKKDSYVMCLLGHEHFMNSNLKESLKCFVSSIQMRPGNISGISGCGLIYERMGRKDNAEYCYMKAIRYNPQNILLGYLAVKFLTIERKIEKAYSLLQKYLGIRDTLDSLAMKIVDEESMINILSVHDEEQISGLLESFLLELACLFAYKGYTEAASILTKSAIGETTFFSIRKSQVMEIIANRKRNSDVFSTHEIG